MNQIFAQYEEVHCCIKRYLVYRTCLKVRSLNLKSLLLFCCVVNHHSRLGLILTTPPLVDGMYLIEQVKCLWRSNNTAWN
jgi:hypothetical protein